LAREAEGIVTSLASDRWRYVLSASADRDARKSMSIRSQPRPPFRFQSWLLSIRRVEVKRFQAYRRLRCLKSLAGPRFSSGSALRLSQYGIRGTRWPNLTRVLIARAESDWHKSHGELTSSIVPRGTSIHQQAELSNLPLSGLRSGGSIKRRPERFPSSSGTLCHHSRCGA
jgi:hypothetical protein